MNAFSALLFKSVVVLTRDDNFLKMNLAKRRSELNVELKGGGGKVVVVKKERTSAVRNKTHIKAREMNRFEI